MWDALERGLTDRRLVTILQAYVDTAVAVADVAVGDATRKLSSNRLMLTLPIDP